MIQCEECDFLVWTDGTDIPNCQKGKRLRFYTPRSYHALDRSFGYKRRECEFFNDSKFQEFLCQEKNNPTK